MPVWNVSGARWNDLLVEDRHDEGLHSITARERLLDMLDLESASILEKLPHFLDNLILKTRGLIPNILFIMNPIAGREDNEPQAVPPYRQKVNNPILLTV